MEKNVNIKIKEIRIRQSTSQGQSKKSAEKTKAILFNYLQNIINIRESF